MMALQTVSTKGEEAVYTKRALQSMRPYKSLYCTETVYKITFDSPGFVH